MEPNAILHGQLKTGTGRSGLRFHCRQLPLADIAQRARRAIVRFIKGEFPQGLATAAAPPAPPTEAWYVLRNLDTSVPWHKRPCCIAKALHGVYYPGELVRKQVSREHAEVALMAAQANGVCGKYASMTTGGDS